MVTPYLQETVIWACFVPIALVSLLVAIIAIAHFRTFYRSLDLLLISLVCGLLVCVIVLFPMFMVIVINRMKWTEILCKIFTWTFVCTRTVGIISLISISVDGVLMLRVPGRYRIYGIIRSKTVHFVILGFWLFGIVLGIIPVVIWGNHSYVNPDNECLFLPYEIADSFAIILAVGEFAGITVSIICIIDAFFYLRHVKSVDDFEENLNKQEKPPLLEKKSKNNRKRNYDLLRALDFTESAKDCWAVTFAVVLISYVISHIPFMLLCVIGVVLPYLVDHVTAVVCMMWLVLLEAIIIPALLWIVSVRYRHAHYYQVMTIICGCQFKTKDEYCDLQQQHRDAHQSQYNTYTFQRPANKYLNAYSSQDSLHTSPSKRDPNSPYIIRASQHDSEEQEVSLYLSQGRKQGYRNQGFVNDQGTMDFNDGDDVSDDVMDGERIEPDKDGVVRAMVTPDPKPDLNSESRGEARMKKKKVNKTNEVIVEHYDNKIVYKSPMSSPNVNKVLVNSRGQRENLQKEAVQRNYARNPAYSSPYSSRDSTLDRDFYTSRESTLDREPRYSSRETTLDSREPRFGDSTLDSREPRFRDSTLDRDGKKGPFVLDSSALMNDLEAWSDRSSNTTSDFRNDVGERDSLGDSEIESILGMTGPNRPRNKNKNFYFNSLERNPSDSVDRKIFREREISQTNPNFEMAKSNSMPDRNHQSRHANGPNIEVHNEPKNYNYNWEKAEKTLSIMEFLMTKEDAAHAPNDTGSMRPDEEVSVFL